MLHTTQIKLSLCCLAHTMFVTILNHNWQLSECFKQDSTLLTATHGISCHIKQCKHGYTTIVGNTQNKYCAPASLCQSLLWLICWVLQRGQKGKAAVTNRQAIVTQTCIPGISGHSGKLSAEVACTESSHCWQHHTLLLVAQASSDAQDPTMFRPFQGGLWELRIPNAGSLLSSYGDSISTYASMLAALRFR